jgi:hypothetical protein
MKARNSETRALVSCGKTRVSLVCSQKSEDEDEDEDEDEEEEEKKPIHLSFSLFVIYLHAASNALM